MKYCRCMIFILVLLTTCMINAYTATDDTLKVELEKAFHNYIAACQTGQLDAVKENMSSFSYGTKMNDAIRTGKEVTSEDAKEWGKNAIPIDKITFVKTLQNGDTAALIYSGAPPEYVEFIGDGFCFCVIKFVREGGSWIYDTEQVMIRLSSEKEFNDSWLEDTLVIDGRVKAAPAAEPKPEIPGTLEVYSNSTPVTIIINGITQLENAEGQHFSWIFGGLKSGHNEIVITTVKKDEYSRPPEIRVRVPMIGMPTSSDESPDSPGTVFYLKPKELGTTQTLGFDVLKKEN